MLQSKNLILYSCNVCANFLKWQEFKKIELNNSLKDNGSIYLKHWIIWIELGYLRLLSSPFHNIVLTTIAKFVFL